MSIAMEIKGIRKWRISHDDLNWIIQQKKKGRQPPNDWVNKYYFTSLEGCLLTLLKLGVAEEKLTDFNRIVSAYNKKSKLIVDAIRSLGEHFDLQPPESIRVSEVKKSIPKRKKKQVKK